MNNEYRPLRIKLTAAYSVTVLPRCLQILSRRGFRMVALSTQPLDNNRSELTITIVGHKRWHAAIPDLLGRLVEVERVEVEEAA